MLEFEQFYLNTKKIVYQYIYSHVQNPSEAEDLVQESYLLALEQWERLQHHPNPGGWLMLTVRHLCTGYHRHIYDRMSSMEEQEDIPYIEHAYNMVVMEDLLESVYNKEQSTLAKRYFIEGNSVEELSKEMGISENAFRNRIYRMRKRLKSFIE